MATLPLDPDLDYTIPLDCGCRVTFLGHDRHETSALTPCRGHRGTGRVDRRHRAERQQQAEDELRLRRLVGPDVPPGDSMPGRRKAVAT